MFLSNKFLIETCLINIILNNPQHSPVLISEIFENENLQVFVVLDNALTDSITFYEKHIFSLCYEPFC